MLLDAHCHVEGNRKLIHERIDALLSALATGEPATVVELVPKVYGEPLTAANGNWRLSETLSYLRHLELQDRVVREPDGPVERWRLAAA